MQVLASIQQVKQAELNCVIICIYILATTYMTKLLTVPSDLLGTKGDNLAKIISGFFQIVGFVTSV